MKLARMEWVSVMAIAIGTTACVAVTGAFLSRSAYDVEVRVTSDFAEDAVVEAVAVEEAVLESASVTAKVRPGSQAEIRLGSSRARVLSASDDPLVYVDGVRIGEGVAFIRTLEPDRIDRIEIIKGAAAGEVFGPAAEGRGVIQIFLKPQTDGSGGN